MAKFEKGDIVQTRNDSTKYGPVVEVVDLVGGLQYYRVLLPYPQGLTTVLEEDLLSFSQILLTPYDELGQSSFSGFSEFLKNISVQRLVRNQPLKNTIYAFNASRTRFYPYQFKPLVKFLESEKNRVLICDEVGLGKTIEAGLILTEYRARFDVNRALVVCPSNLRQKWKNELRNRFDEDFRILGSNDFLGFLDAFEENPEKASLNGIVSIETVRSNRCLQKLEQIAPDFDIVIVDEAHHMRNFGRKQRKAGVLLSEEALSMVMLTATPVQLGIENLFSLLNILNPDEFPARVTAEERFRMNEPIVMAQNCLSRIPPLASEGRGFLMEAGRYPIIRNNPFYTEACNAVDYLEKTINDKVGDKTNILAQIEAQRALSELNLIGNIYTRTKRREVQEGFTHRKPYPVEVEFTKLEMEFYKRVTEYVRALSAERGHGSVIQKWVLNLPQRRMASSIPAMVEYYKKQVYVSNEMYVENKTDIEDIEEFSEEDINESDENEVLSVPVATERLREILLLWPEGAEDSKYNKFRDAVEMIRKNDKGIKILVFAFFKGTLRYLQKRLSEEGVGTVLISGDVPGEERPNLIEKFQNDPGTEIMLSSKVGTEGLDFQFCHVLFNYDLPWNPMEVEQRIGRLDRIGQESKFINIFHFWIKDTIEERILKRLYDRIGVFERSIGDLELILGEIVRDLEQEMFSKELSPEMEEMEVSQILLALERRQRELKDIESDAAKFIGTDMFFEQQIEEAQRLRRYVTPVQIRALVEDFIENNVPQTRMEYDRETGRGKLYPGQDLLDILASFGLLREFQTVTVFGNKGRDITFESEVAFREPKREFVNVLHPLVRSIARYHYEKSANTGRCHFVCLTTQDLKLGLYFFFIYLTEIHAAKDQFALEYVILNDFGEEACENDLTELVFSEMLENGRNSVQPAPIFEQVTMRNLCYTADRTVAQRVANQREQLQRTNNLFIDRRLGILDSFYGRILEQRKERLQNETNKFSPDERILRLLQGEIRNREAQLHSMKKELESRRKIEITYKSLCLGCLQIENEFVIPNMGGGI